MAEERKMKWFRSWHGAPTDLKWIMVAKKAKVPVGTVVAVVWALYDYASQREGDDRGSIISFPVDQVAAFFGYEEDEVYSIMKALTDVGLIEDDRVVNWNKYQPKRDREDATAAERQRRKRAKDTENCHAQSRPVTPPLGRDNCDMTNVTPLRDKILDRKKEVNKTFSKKPVCPPDGERAPTRGELEGDFDEWYKIYPRHTAVGRAREAYLKARGKKGVTKEILLEAARAAAKYWSKENKQFIPYPATWLNGEQWTDDYTGPPPTREMRQRGFREEIDFFEGAI